MDALNPAGSSASALAQWSAVQGARGGDAGGDASPEAISALAEAGDEGRFTMAVLKKTLTIDAESANGLAGLLGDGGHVDVYA